MAYESLSNFLTELEDTGELVRVSAEVDPHLEIAAIADRVCKMAEGGPALLFENVRGHTLPIVVNLLGSRRRMCRALGADSFDEVAARIAGLVQPDVPAGWLEGLRLVPRFAELTRLPPRTVKSGVCQQVVKLGRDVDLGELPVLRCWPHEPAPTITAGQVYTKNPAGVRHVGLYPLQVRDGKSLLVHWNAHQEGFRYLEEYRRTGRPMPLAVVLGGDPVYPLMASAPLPPQTDACLFGGFLRGEHIDLVKCRCIDLEVPVDAEIVLEGQIDPSAPPEPAGPLGGPTGFYTLPEPAPVLHVTALTHRANPVFPAMVFGRPPMEDYWLGRALERMFLPLVRLFVPEVVDLHQPPCGAFRHLLFVSLRKEYPQQARKVMHALWSLGGLMVAKIIVAVDAEVDVQDEEQVWRIVGANVHPGRDVLFCEGPADMDDHAAPVRGMGHKMGIDATRKLPEEGHSRPWPAPLALPADIEDRVARRWTEYGLP